MLRFFFPICFDNRTCYLFSLISTTLQLVAFWGVINATSFNPKQGLWGLIKGKYLFLADLLCRTGDLGICLFGFFKPQTVFVYKALYQALQVTLN